MPQPHVTVFKYPLGFIRVVEFIFIVIAIAAVNSWSFSMNFECTPVVNATDKRIVKVEASTFTLSSVKVHNTCTTSQDVPLWKSDNDAGGSAGFFYFVNVTALILVLVTAFFYVIFWDLYQENKRFALADLAATVLFFVLFFFCSSIWWAGSNTIGYSTGEEEITKLIKESADFGKPDAVLGLERFTSNGKLAISVLCDWVCVLCFAFNCWYIWKEIAPRDQETPGVIG